MTSWLHHNYLVTGAGSLGCYVVDCRLTLVPSQFCLKSTFSVSRRWWLDWSLVSSTQFVCLWCVLVRCVCVLSKVCLWFCQVFVFYLVTCVCVLVRCICVLVRCVCVWVRCVCVLGRCVYVIWSVFSVGHWCGI